MNNSAYEFWKRVDQVRTGKAMSEIARVASVSYKNVKDQRSLNRLPKLEDAYKLSKALNVSVEFLLTGVDNHVLSPRSLAIAKACEKASDLELEMVERILGISSKKGEHEGNRAQ